ncbi:MAG: hypothetical protein CM1200mP18_23260 [Gammaproteobacteria bacterium]|nr:MAG: hypothetical protein CM1200mP18_23260 [Gammaproteobacteria bacterium]
MMRFLRLRLSVDFIRIGEKEVVAFVVLKPGGKASKEELDNFCLENIARFKRPKSYRFLDSLPKNNYGKILKTELRQQLESDSDEPGHRTDQ